MLISWGKRNEVAFHSLKERVKGVEPSSPVWKTGALTVELHPHAPWATAKIVP